MHIVRVHLDKLSVHCFIVCDRPYCLEATLAGSGARFIGSGGARVARAHSSQVTG